MATISDDLLAAMALYCRLELNDENVRSELTSYYHSAVSYLYGAGIIAPADDHPLRHSYDSVVRAMVLDEYDNRGRQSEDKLVENPAFRMRLNQLKFSLGVPQ